MPTYTYHCTECGHQFNLFHAISDESEKHCPVCESVAKRRIGTGMGVIFKGSGFYETDYKRKQNGTNGHHAPHTPANGTNGVHKDDVKDAAAKAEKSDTKAEPKKPKAEKAD